MLFVGNMSGRSRRLELSPRGTELSGVQIPQFGRLVVPTLHANLVCRRQDVNSTPTTSPTTNSSCTLEEITLKLDEFGNLVATFTVLLYLLLAAVNW